jgi:hypothetical protein
MLLKWDKVDLFSMRGERKPFDYWKLMRERQNEIKVLHDEDFKGRFGMELHFFESDISAINLANPMKALLDGIICAFHRMPKGIDRNMLTEVSARLNLPVEQFLYTSKTILGEETFVRPYRKNVFWNPQDDRCSSVSMSIEYGAERRCFSGCIYKIS